MIKKNIPFRLFFLTAFLISAGLFNYAHAGSATLSWNANTESDLAGYRIYYGMSARTGTCPTGGYPNNINVGNVAAYTFSNLTDGSTYYFSITAYDTSGNESCFSSQVSKLIPASSDVSAPTVPTGLTASAVSSSQISLSWAASTDNTGVTGYKIYRGGVQIATSATNNYVDTGLSPSTAYSYAVSAYDAAGNNSSQSSSVSATTLAASLPAPGTVSNLSASAANSTSVTLSFTQVNDGNGQPAKYDVRYATPTISWGSAQSVTNGTCSTPLVGTQIGTTMVCAVNGLTPSTQYQFQLVSYRGTLNAGAVFGGLSNVVSATTPSGSTPDASAPTTPTGLTATAVSSSQINLSWAASTDNVGVTGYRIYRGGNQIATSATTNYSNTGLSPSTAYTYTVSAYDAAGNNSLQSASVTTTSLSSPGGGVIFQDGFESGNFNAWGYGQGLTVSNLDHHSGQYAARGVSTQGATTDLYREKAFGDHPNAGGPAIDGGVYFKFAHKYDAGFNLGTQQNYNKIFLMNFEDPSNVRRDQVIFETNVNSGYASRGEYMFELTHWTASGGWLTGSLRLQNRNGSPLLYREGQWDVIKVYLQPNTPNQNNGILRMWVNGVLKAEHTDVNIRFEPYNLNLAILSSYITVTDVSGTRWWDDVIISQTDPDSGSDTTPPAAPTGLAVN